MSDKEKLTPAIFQALAGVAGYESIQDFLEHFQEQQELGIDLESVEMRAHRKELEAQGLQAPWVTEKEGDNGSR